MKQASSSSFDGTAIPASAMRYAAPIAISALLVGRPTSLPKRQCAIFASVSSLPEDDDHAHPAQPQESAAASKERQKLELQRLEACLRIATLEQEAEQAEADNDLPSAIAAYEELLALQPPTSPALREEDAARRALQQLLLESARAELEACGEEGCETSFPSFKSPPSEFIEDELRRAPQFLEGEIRRAQQAGEGARKELASRALADVERIRNTVVRLLALTEEQARERAVEAAGEQAYSRLVDGDPGWLSGLQIAEAQKRMDDARLLRKSIEADLNRLELQLLQGDPSLAFIRDVLKSTRDEQMLQTLESNSLWLKEQFDTGALPRDTELLRTLLAKARDDPDMVVRLVTQAKDGQGKDLYTRRENDRSGFEFF